MKRLCSLVIALLLLLTSLPAQGQGFDTTAGVAVLLEATTGQFLYLKNADERRPPASITKIMTLLLAFEAIERGDITWEETTRVSTNAWQKTGSTMFLEWNTLVTVEDLIKGISIVSANDGCIALAEHLTGSEAAFVQRMNQRAQELGMNNSNFRNSTGLPEDGHYMSARDVAIVAQELINKHPKILEFEAQRDFTYNNIPQFNRNPLLGRYPGADGLKTGWTNESQFSLAGTAQRDGRRLISVVLNTPSDAARLTASQELLNHGFQNFELITLAEEGAWIGEAAVEGGRLPTVEVAAIGGPTQVSIPRGRQNEIELVIEGDPLAAPVAAGTPAGRLLVQLEGETIYTVPVQTAVDVGRANILVRMFRGIANFFRRLVVR